MLLASVTGSAAESPIPVIRSLGELQGVALTNNQHIASLSLTGLVCSADEVARLVTLKDESAVVLLGLPQLESGVRPGDWLAVNATNVTLESDNVCVRVGTAPIAEMDALHPPLARSGRVFLAVGWHPIQLEWFNGEASGYLEVNYEGPDFSMQRIPDAALRCRPSDVRSDDEFRPGLSFAVYRGTNWNVLPDFRQLTPLDSGISANVDVSNYLQELNVAVQLSGFLNIQTAGVYTFQLTCDDGARLYVGDPTQRCFSERQERSSPPPVALNLAQAMSGRDRQQWVTLEGEATFASRRDGLIELEVAHRDIPVSALIANARTIVPASLPGQRLRLTGIYHWPLGARAVRLTIPGAEQVQPISKGQKTHDSKVPITIASDVRGLQPDEARQGLPAAIRGVVTTANSRSCVVQDATGPVFVRPDGGVWPTQLRLGELWEFHGVTDPGEFSPIILASDSQCLGKGTLPPPIRPSWEQLLNGSMDVELVEVPGIVLETGSDEMTLLTHGGQVSVVGHWEYPLPYHKALVGGDQPLIGARVRVRGVFFALRDSAGQLIPGRFLLGDPMISVDELAPENPFELPTRHVKDLLRFTSHADPLRRFKFVGQVLYAQQNRYFLMDGEDGFRLSAEESLPLAEGDLIEAVGFPQLGGPSPVLLQAVARRTGTDSLPAPRQISVSDLFDERLDSILVQVQARLLGNTSRQNENVLELQTGSAHFFARLRGERLPAAQLRPGADLQITGVYASNRGTGTDAGRSGFELLLTSATDLVVLKPGPWWTARRIVTLVSILLFGLVASFVWITLLRRTVARRTVLLKEEIHHREQTEQRRLLEQERARVAHDLHDDLGAGLAQISLIGSLAQRPATPSDRLRVLASEITDKSREMVTALDEIVWAINPTHDTATSVRGYLTDYAQEFLRPTSIVCRLDAMPAQPTAVVSSAHRHQLFLAFKEALTNVVKHSKATEVRIRIATSAGEIVVTIEDNGEGLSLSHQAPGGTGLESMHARLEQVGGRCEIKHRIGGGTVVSLRLPANG